MGKAVLPLTTRYIQPECGGSLYVLLPVTPTGKPIPAVSWIPGVLNDNVPPGEVLPGIESEGAKGLLQGYRGRHATDPVTRKR
jgi:hypothetical protein